MTTYIQGNLLQTKSTLLDYDLHSIYYKYHYYCMQHNYKTLDLHDFSIHINFIWKKLCNLIKQLHELTNYITKAKLQALENKLKRLEHLVHNPNYEIEFISPILHEIEHQLNELSTLNTLTYPHKTDNLNHQK